MFEGDGPRVAAPFGALEAQEWEWSRAMTREQLHLMAGSRSYVITAPVEEKTRIRRELDALFDDLGLGDGGTLELPYVTRAFRAVRA